MATKHIYRSSFGFIKYTRPGIDVPLKPNMASFHCFVVIMRRAFFHVHLFFLLCLFSLGCRGREVSELILQLCSFFLLSLSCPCQAAVVILVPLLLNLLLRPLLFLPSLAVAIPMGFDGRGLGKLLPFPVCCKPPRRSHL